METNNIAINLKNRAMEDLKKEFKVVIVCDESVSQEELTLKDYKKLMKNIVSGSLTGQRILELSMHEKIVSIEEDIDACIL
jgi:hypothetical protein